MLKWLLTWHVLYTVNIIFLRLYCEYTYRKPPTISPGLIYFRKRFLMGYTRESLYTGEGAGANTWAICCVSNKQVRPCQT